MFKVDKEDGLFTSNSVFLVFREDRLYYLFTFQDDTDTFKKWRVFKVQPIDELFETIFHDFSIPWKAGHDSISAKKLVKEIAKIEKLGFDVWFYPYTIKKDQLVKDFYLQYIESDL